MYTLAEKIKNGTFARQLLDDLEEGLATVKGVKQARDWFKKCCDNSMFER